MEVGVSAKMYSLVAECRFVSSREVDGKILATLDIFPIALNTKIRQEIPLEEHELGLFKEVDSVNIMIYSTNGFEWYSEKKFTNGETPEYSIHIGSPISLRCENCGHLHSTQQFDS